MAWSSSAGDFYSDSAVMTAAVRTAWKKPTSPRIRRAFSCGTARAKALDIKAGNGLPPGILRPRLALGSPAVVYWIEKASDPSGREERERTPPKRRWPDP
jgi:hypothetical protein